MDPKLTRLGLASVGQGSVRSDDEIVAELDYFQPGYGRYPTGLTVDCPGCPFAIKGKGKNGADYKFQSYGVRSGIDLTFTIADDTLVLNNNPFFDTRSGDLHHDQYTIQSAWAIESQPDAYNGRLPITYDVKLVQTRTVQLEDGMLLEFYSIDIQVTSLAGQKITIKKVNVHMVEDTKGQ
ncbi:MAG: hypothetical protein Q9219_007531, partial [cf. Caloplaca sp. 3 TL-2023]